MAAPERPADSRTVVEAETSIDSWGRRRASAAKRDAARNLPESVQRRSTWSNLWSNVKCGSNRVRPNSGLSLPDFDPLRCPTPATLVWGRRPRSSRNSPNFIRTGCLVCFRWLRGSQSAAFRASPQRKDVGSGGACRVGLEGGRVAGPVAPEAPVVRASGGSRPPRAGAAAAEANAARSRIAHLLARLEASGRPRGSGGGGGRLSQSSQGSERCPGPRRGAPAKAGAGPRRGGGLPRTSRRAQRDPRFLLPLSSQPDTWRRDGFGRAPQQDHQTNAHHAQAYAHPPERMLNRASRVARTPQLARRPEGPRGERRPLPSYCGRHSQLMPPATG